MTAEGAKQDAVKEPGRNRTYRGLGMLHRRIRLALPGEDETVVVLSGEAFITNGAGEECRLAEGHVAFFPGGTSSKWRVTRPIIKVALLRKDLPPPLGFGVRVWHLLLRLSGLRGGSRLVPAARNPPVSDVLSEAQVS
jgi:hypothetical protein